MKMHEIFHSDSSHRFETFIDQFTENNAILQFFGDQKIEGFEIVTVKLSRPRLCYTPGLCPSM